MLSYAKLSGNARRFRTIMGMSLQEFDLLLAKVEKTHPETERDRLSKRPRKRAIGAGRRFALDLRGRVMLLLRTTLFPNYPQSRLADPKSDWA